MLRPTDLGNSSRNIEFDDHKLIFHTKQSAIVQSDNSGIIGFLIKRSIVKTEKQAVVLLLLICVVLIGITVFIFKFKTVHPAILDNTLQQY